MAFTSESSTTLVDPNQHYAMDEKILAPPQNQQNLTLQVDFAWSKFRNEISIKNGEQLQPLFIQRFKTLKNQLKWENAADGTEIATSQIHAFHTHAEANIHGRELKLQPLKKLQTRYNYLSQTLAPYVGADAVPISWVTECSMKTWDFLCLDQNQQCIAKFSVNIWAAKQVGNFHFEKPADQISDAARDEIVIMGITLLYVMVTRMNNPLNLVGAAFTKTGKVDGTPEDVELQDQSQGKKHV